MPSPKIVKYPKVSKAQMNNKNALGHFGVNMRVGNERTVVPTTLDIAWAAGIYEGEGSCEVNRRTQRVKVTQKDRWILDKLQKLFGGRLSKTPNKGCSTWQCYATRARGFLMTIYSFLSPWRKAQALRVLRG